MTSWIQALANIGVWRTQTMRKHCEPCGESARDTPDYDALRSFPDDLYATASTCQTPR